MTMPLPPNASEDWRSDPVSALELGGRAMRFIVHYLPPSTTVGKLSNYSDSWMLSHPKVGPGTVREIRAAILAHAAARPSHLDDTTTIEGLAP